MSSLTLRHYDATLGYRSQKIARFTRSARENFRSRFSRRQWKRRVRGIFPL